MQLDHSDQSKQPLEVELHICRGLAENNIREITVPVYVIGTAYDCDLILGDPQFPDCYCYIYTQDDSISLRRMPEGPDLSVNGEVVNQCELKDQDLIRCGPFQFRLSIKTRHQDDDFQPSKKNPMPVPKLKSLPKINRTHSSRGFATNHQLISDVKNWIENYQENREDNGSLSSNLTSDNFFDFELNSFLQDIPWRRSA